MESSEEDMFIEVKYKGLPFSGTAYEHTERFHSEYSYLNGFGHGRCFSVYTNGQLYEEFFLDNGIKIEEKTWYENGIMQEYFRRAPLLWQFWNNEGILMLEETNEIKKEWYSNAKLKGLFTKKNEYVFYGGDGEWAVKINTDDNYIVMDKNKMTFNTRYLEDNYMELLEDHDFYKYFIIWLMDLEHAKKEEVICNMIKSNNLSVKYDGINLSAKYKIHNAIPYIKLEIDNDEIPPPIYDLRGVSSLIYAHTISQRASIALKELEQ